MKKYLLVVFCALSCLLGGCGGSPTATLSTTSVSFGSVAVGATSAENPITLSNTGSATLNIDGIVTTGDFGQTHNCGSTLATGANCTINVTFSPTAAGDLTGTLSVTDNATGSPHTVSLTGTGIVITPRCALKGQSCFNRPCCPGLHCLISPIPFCQ